MPRSATAEAVSSSRRSATTVRRTMARDRRHPDRRRAAGSSVTSIGRSSSVMANFTKGSRDWRGACGGTRASGSPSPRGHSTPRARGRSPATQASVMRRSWRRAPSTTTSRDSVPASRSAPPTTTRPSSASHASSGGASFAHEVVCRSVSPDPSRRRRPKSAAVTCGSMRQLRPMTARGGIEARFPMRVRPGVQALRLVAVRAEVVAGYR